MIWCDNPSNLPNPAEIDYMEEPMAKASIMVPKDYVGNVMELCQERRGTFKNMDYSSGDRVEIKYDLPLNEIIYDFFDALKSRTKGYASYDYEMKGYEKSKLVTKFIKLRHMWIVGSTYRITTHLFQGGQTATPYSRSHCCTQTSGIMMKTITDIWSGL